MTKPTKKQTAAAIQRLKALAGSGRKIVISVVTEKGGCAKSTSSIILASGFASHGFDTVLVDTDQKNKTAQHWAAHCEDNPMPTVVGITEPDGLRKTIPQLREKYDAIVIDGAAQAEKMLTSAVAQADLVVLPTKPSPPDIWSLADGVVDKLRNTQSLRENAGASPAKMLFLVTMGKRGSRLVGEVESALEPFGIPVLSSRLSDLVGYSESLIRTNPLNSMSQEVREEANEFFEEVLAELDSYYNGLE
jgi:chromosome partitioning protein